MPKSKDSEKASPSQPMSTEERLRQLEDSLKEERRLAAEGRAEAKAHYEQVTTKLADIVKTYAPPDVVMKMERDLAQDKRSSDSEILVKVEAAPDLEEIVGSGTTAVAEDSKNLDDSARTARGA
jgi:hypothetical protein